MIKTISFLECITYQVNVRYHPYTFKSFYESGLSHLAYIPEPNTLLQVETILLHIFLDIVVFYVFCVENLQIKKLLNYQLIN